MRDQPGCTDFAPRTPSLLFINRLGRLAMEHEFEGKPQGLTSVEYAQADLLKLGSLERSFDVIESVGVLHHLADPWAGWQVLLSLLHPGGFMELGFYSAAARRNIVRIWEFIAE